MADKGSCERPASPNSRVISGSSRPDSNVNASEETLDPRKRNKRLRMLYFILWFVLRLVVFSVAPQRGAGAASVPSDIGPPLPWQLNRQSKNRKIEESPAFVSIFLLVGSLFLLWAARMSFVPLYFVFVAEEG
jgi:hypothetical protein